MYYIINQYTVPWIIITVLLNLRTIMNKIRKLIEGHGKYDQEFNLICGCQQSEDTQANDRKKGSTNKDKFTQVDFLYEDPVPCPRRRPESRKTTLQPLHFGTESVAAARFSLQLPAQNFGLSTYVPQQPLHFGMESVAAPRFSLQPPAQNFGPSTYVPQRSQHFGTESGVAVRFAFQQQPPEVYVGPPMNGPFQPRPSSLIPGVAATADFGFTSPPPPRYYAGPAWFGVNGPPPLPSCVKFAYPPPPLRR